MRVRMRVRGEGWGHDGEADDLVVEHTRPAQRLVRDRHLVGVGVGVGVWVGVKVGVRVGVRIKAAVRLGLGLGLGSGFGEVVPRAG